MNEIGVDPGVDHLYALKTINEVHAEGGKVLATLFVDPSMPISSIEGHKKQEGI